MIVTWSCSWRKGITGVKGTEKSLNANLNVGINSDLREFMILVVCYLQVFEPCMFTSKNINIKYVPAQL